MAAKKKHHPRPAPAEAQGKQEAKADVTAAAKGKPRPQAESTAAAKGGPRAQPKATAAANMAPHLDRSPQVRRADPPLVKESRHPAVKESQAPAVKADAPPAVRKDAPPATRPEATLAVKGSMPPAQKSAAAPAVKGDMPPVARAEATPAAHHGTPSAPKADVPPPKEDTTGTHAAMHPTATTKAGNAAAKAGSMSLRPRPRGDNPYLPQIATVAEIIPETHNIKTLRVVLDDAEAMRSFVHEPGQVGQLSVFGAGESTFVINSPPSQRDHLQFSVMRAGEVTAAIHRLSPGDKVGVRAPLGNSFPCEAWKGKDVIFVGGGIGMAPLRVVMLHMLERKRDYGRIGLLYGARSPADMAFSYELDGWMANPDLDCTLCIDAPAEGWPHKVGLIPNVLLELAPKPDNCIAVLCGPPIMIKFTVQALEKLGFASEAIVTTLEKRMKCGIGICGRCNIGGRYVCVDGPVFTWEQLQQLPPEL